MAAVNDLNEVLERFHLGQGELVKGNPEPCKKLFSHRDDVTLNNPLSPTARGWHQVADTIDRAASSFRDGELVSADIIQMHVTTDLAYVVEQERGRAKVRGKEGPWALRVTMIFRLEEGTWKIVHRHADPISTEQPAESVIQN